MKRLLLPSSRFARSAKKLVRKNKELALDLQIVLEMLAEDAFSPKLKTHKLSGKLSGSWACSVGYDMRVVFQFTKHKGVEAILLEDLGSHDVVY
ncbi:MAG: type II toxin-antitoxin system mRNA interferase toxin, RelE/StbE family [Verrucomicrobiota bacterium]|nr:type II toxin-antitoxin system mRNA interferase toxin, RelE/StbE family [Verrucomicrobiota bacterium]